MNRILYFLLFIIISDITYGQINIGDIIRLNNQIKVKGDPDKLISPLGKDKAIYLGPYLYKVIRIENDIVKLLALNFETPDTSERKKNPEKVFLSDIYNYKLYTVSKDEFIAFSEKVEKSDIVRLGVVTLPFKLRLKDNMDFDTEFSINSTVNIRICWDWLNILAGAGIGSVGLNNSNAFGVKEGEEQDVTTLSFLTGFMIEYNKLQIIISLGWDHINNQESYKWKHNGDHWIGLGLGYNIFSVITGKANEN